MNQFIYFSLKWASDPARKSDRTIINLFYLQQLSLATPFVSDKYLDNQSAIKAFNQDDIILIGSTSNLSEKQQMRVCDITKEYLCPSVAVYSTILDEQDDPRLKSILSSREIGFENHIILSCIALEKFEYFQSPTDLNGLTVNNYGELVKFRHPFEIAFNRYPLTIPELCHCVGNSFNFFTPFLRHFSVTVPDKEVETIKEKKHSFKASGLEGYAKSIPTILDEAIKLDQIVYTKSYNAAYKKVKIQTPAVEEL